MGAFLLGLILEFPRLFAEAFLKLLRTWFGLIAEQRFKLQFILVGAQFANCPLLEMGSWITQQARSGGKMINKW